MNKTMVIGQSTRTTRHRSSWAPVLLCLLLLTPALLMAQAAPDSQKHPRASEPDGLESFLQARLLEANGRYSEAADKYAEALRLAPDQVEIRVAYASLMLKYGLPDTAYSLLQDQQGLDWYGRRTLALAMTQLAIHQEDLLDDTEKTLRQLIEERPDDANLLLSHAQILNSLGRFQEAEAIVADLRSSRDNQQIVAFHAALLQALNRPAEAAELYRLCLDSPTRGILCRERLSQLLIDLGRPAEAGEAMLQWLEPDEYDQLLQAAALLSEGGRSEQALQVVRRVLAAVPGSARARTFEALLLSATGRFNEAAEKLSSLLRQEGDSIDLLLPLAWAEVQRGQLAKARELIDRAWKLVGGGVDADNANRCCLTAARIELSQGKPLVAREWLERAPDPQLAGAELVQLLAETYRRSEEWQDGMAAMLRLQPRVSGQARLLATANEAEFRLRMGSSKGYQRLQPLLASGELEEVAVGLQVLQVLERWDDVEREAAAALTRFPGERDLLFTRAAALERIGRIAEAETLFEQLLEMDPGDTASANYLGYMWADKGVKLEKALDLISRAVEAEPNNAAYIDSLGWIHFRLGNLEEAELWLRRATALGAEDGTVISHLGEVLLTVGQQEEARLLLQQALDLGCENPEHIRGLLEQLGQ